MFTVEDLSPRMVDVLSKVAAGLQLKIKNIYFQSYVESFYYYVLHQPAELWKNKVLIFDYFDGNKVNGFTFTGKIPQYEPDTKIYMFASHSHKDHYDMDILRYAEKYPNIKYIFC